ncbi:unnamed protein product [Thelazia callipaeda]|uniref:HNH endonuclease n=1 Tax=Thelazia callipaeda TaxID=103827 RepID=A0A0N5DAT6_THECL|nr:unnamed protein product [Thelazia callipaeda]
MYGRHSSITTLRVILCSSKIKAPIQTYQQNSLINKCHHNRVTVLACYPPGYIRSRGGFEVSTYHLLRFDPVMIHHEGKANYPKRVHRDNHRELLHCSEHENVDW